MYQYIKNNIKKKSLTYIINTLSKDYDIIDIELILNLDFDINILVNKKQIRDTRQDNLYKKEIKKKYNNKCIISGCSTCQVCHIIPFSVCETEFEQYNINNGLLLSNNLHKEFDDYKFSINPKTLKIEINHDKIKNGKYDILSYENKKVNIDSNSIKYLEYHYYNFKLL